MDLAVEQFASPLTLKNEYLLAAGREAAVIDAADCIEPIATALKNGDLELRYLFITHGHPSHLNALGRLKERFGGIFCVHPLERDLLRQHKYPLDPDRLLKDNQKLPLGQCEVTVLHTPGHTRGSVSFYVKKARALFSGSSLLKGGYGRIWGPKSMSLMLFSLKRLNYAIPSDTVVYPRSGERTRMGAEAWLNCLRSA